MASDNGLFVITLNVDGEDFQYLVDIDTANILLNDEEQARQFVEKTRMETENKVAQPTPSTSSSGSESTASVWTNRRSTNKDDEATHAFLRLRAKYDAQFNDRKTIKAKIWQKISKELELEGFSLGEQAAEKCRQKFANLQKQYINHIKHVKTTGEKKRPTPPFFDELHSILGDKHKINPENTQDSMDNEDLEEAGKTTEEKISEISTIKNRFANCKKNIERPKSSSDKYISFLKNEMEEDRKTNKKQFEIMENLLKTQNEQRERMLGIFENLLHQRKRKRPLQEESEDESD